jgi:hypothetical protein
MVVNAYIGTLEYHTVNMHVTAHIPDIVNIDPCMWQTSLVRIRHVWCHVKKVQLNRKKSSTAVQGGGP